jgi:hypothetical protein
VVAFHRTPVEEYVRRRHAHLKTYGAKNPEIFARIAEELADRVVAAPPLTERQLRRIVYTKERSSCAESSGTWAASRPPRCCSRA